MANRTTQSSIALAKSADETPTVRTPPSDWHPHKGPSQKPVSQPPTDGLWQLVCDVMRAEADEALWGMRR